MLFPNENSTKKTKDEMKRLSTVKTVNTSERFYFKERCDFSKQFSHIYATRLNNMRELLTVKAVEKWGKKYPVKRMTDLREENPEKCIVVGTIFVAQKLKPSILREISEKNQLAPQPVRLNCTDESDMLILEDEVQRIQLLGEMKVHSYVTGIVCAVLGYEEGDGKFFVDDCLFYECGPQKPLKELSTSPLLVIVSGLDQSSTRDFSMSLDLFQNWLYGNLPYLDNDTDFEAANVARIIIAGNSVRTSFEVKQQSRLLRAPESVATLQAVQAVDSLMAEWSKSCPVDVMPGEFDPANFMLPQQPMHQCMFPQSKSCGVFRSVTNPYEITIEDRLVLGTSGQNVANIQKYSKIEDPLDVLKSLAKWSHIAPTCPDTLACYPYYKDDPFIVTQCPHILFAGNTSEFRTDIFEGSDGKRIRLVCVPAFARSESVVVINLRTLECKQLCFKINGFDNIEI